MPAAGQPVIYPLYIYVNKLKFIHQEINKEEELRRKEIKEIIKK